MQFGDCVPRTSEDDPFCAALVELADMGHSCFACEEGFRLAGGKCSEVLNRQTAQPNSAAAWKLKLTGALVLGLFFVF